MAEEWTPKKLTPLGGESEVVVEKSDPTFSTPLETRTGSTAEPTPVYTPKKLTPIEGAPTGTIEDLELLLKEGEERKKAEFEMFRPGPTVSKSLREKYGEISELKDYRSGWWEYQAENRNNPIAMMMRFNHSAVDKVFEVVTRPGSAVSAGVQAAIMNSNPDLYEMGAKRLDPWSYFTKGLKGEIHYSWIDILERAAAANWKKGVDDWDHPLLNKAIGFGLDVATDPLAWATPTKFGRLMELTGIGRAAKRVGQIPFVASAAAAVDGAKAAGFAKLDDFFQKVKGTTPFREIGGAFVPYFDISKYRGAPEFFREYNQQKEAMQRFLLKDAEERFNGFRDTAYELGWSKEQLPHLMERAILAEQLQKYHMIHVDLQPYMKGIRETFQDLAGRELQAGIMTPDMLLENYFPGIMKDMESGKAITNMGYRSKPFFVYDKEFQTVEQGNKAVEEWNKNYGIPLSKKDIEFITNPFEAQALRRFVGENALLYRGMVDDALRKFSLPARVFQQFEGKGLVPVLPTHTLPRVQARSLQDKLLREALAEEPDSSILQLFADRGGGTLVKLTPRQMGLFSAKDVHFMPTEIFDEIKRSSSLYISDKALRGFIAGFDRTTNFWKTMATSFRLPFHLRNMENNYWQVYLGGVPAVEIPKRAAQAAWVQNGGERGSLFGLRAKDLQRIFDDVGVRGYGWVAADIPSFFGKQLERVTDPNGLLRYASPSGLVEGATSAAKAFGSTIEDNARIALGLHLMEKGGLREGLPVEQVQKIAQEAAVQVKRFMFDYSELTGFERTAMKRIFPFYTWPRKNIPLVLSTLVSDPVKYSRLARFEEGLWPVLAGGGGKREETERERRVKPEMMTQRQAMKSGWVDEGNNPIYYSLDLGVNDLNKIDNIKHLYQFASQSLNPLFILPLMVGGVTMNPEPRLLNDVPGRRVPAPFWAGWFGSADPKAKESWTNFMDLGPMLDPRTKKVVMGMDPRWKASMVEALPFLGDWERMFPQPSHMILEDEGKWKALSYLTGIRFQPLNLSEQEGKLGLALKKFQEDNPVYTKSHLEEQKLGRNARDIKVKERMAEFLLNR